MHEVRVYQNRDEGTLGGRKTTSGSPGAQSVSMTSWPTFTSGPRPTGFSMIWKSGSSRPGPKLLCDVLQRAEPVNRRGLTGR